MKLIELCLTMAYEEKNALYGRSGVSKILGYTYLFYLRDKNIVIPQKSTTSKSDKFDVVDFISMTIFLSRR